MKRILTLAFLGLAGISAAAPLYTGPFGPDGTWNLYQLVEKSLTWDEARKEAETLPSPAGDPAVKGHLVTFGSFAENQFVRNLNRQEAWCGLTDEERLGGHEAGSNPRDGWKWLDGTPMTFSNWLPDQPDDWKNGGSGEDGTYFQWSGRWADNGMGTPGQSGYKFYFVVEWETRSKTPVAGATTYERVWPEKSVMPEYVPGKWNARWVSGYVKFPSNWIESPRTLTDAMALLKGSDKLKALPQSDGSAVGKLPWLWISTPGGNHPGWLSYDHGRSNFPKLPPENNCVGAVIGKIHVEKAGPHTFAISAKDAFALRIGGLKWKSAGGDAYIDPLDPLTVAQPNGSFVTKALAVMDLPAGDHLVEALWMAETSHPDFQVLSAPGVHETQGSTTDWRPLGHAGSAEKIPRLGITEAGWTVECSRPSDKSLGLQDGLLKLNMDSELITKTGLPAINFTQGAGTISTRFPGAAAFPNDRPGGNHDHWPLHTTARLVVPQDGSYQIGIRAAGLAAVRVKDGVYEGFVPSFQSVRNVHHQADTFDFNGQTDLESDPEIVTAWKLKKGEYDLDVFYVKNIGPASLAVYSCPQGPYLPALIAIGGAKITDDVPGLPHAAP